MINPDIWKATRCVISGDGKKFHESFNKGEKAEETELNARLLFPQSIHPHWVAIPSSYTQRDVKPTFKQFSPNFKLLCECPTALKYKLNLAWLLFSAADLTPIDCQNPFRKKKRLSTLLLQPSDNIFWPAKKNDNCANQSHSRNISRPPLPQKKLEKFSSPFY